jgi:hypothetical protein
MATFHNPVSVVHPSVFAPEPRRQEVWQAVRTAVRAYAREPSEPHAHEVERAVAALRRHDERRRGLTGS